jgi:hypothetical protein
VNVRLLDLNDEPPVFTEEEYVFSAVENAAIGTYVGSVTAIDRDQYDTVR